MIEINDCFRLRSSKQSHWNFTLWHLEEWLPGTRIEGVWHRCSERMKHGDMDSLLEQMLCPTGPHEAFRAAEERGPKGAFAPRVSKPPGLPLEKIHP